MELPPSPRGTHSWAQPLGCQWVPNLGDDAVEAVVGVFGAQPDGDVALGVALEVGARLPVLQQLHAERPRAGGQQGLPRRRRQPRLVHEQAAEGGSPWGATARAQPCWAGREGAGAGHNVGLGGDSQWGWAQRDVVGSGEGGSWPRRGSRGREGGGRVLSPVGDACPRGGAAHLMLALVSSV